MEPTPPAQPPSKKRKRTQTHAASPAPSDATDTNKASTDLLASRADLSSRPILTISRGPIFVAAPEGSPWNKTEMVAMNRVGYRYIPAGINPPGRAAPCRTIESNPTSFRVSWEDRSPYLRVTKDGLCLAGAKGFRSARCNAPIREGKWYLEVRILQGGPNHNPSAIVVDESNGLPPPPPPLDDRQRREGPYVRLGFGRREAPLNGPAGLDGYSYGYRDKTGDKVTLSRPRPYGQTFSTGDVVGMYISLPPKRQPNPRDTHDPAHLHRERIPIDFKGQEVFEILEYPQCKEMTSLMDYSAGKGSDTGSIASGAGTKKAGVGVKPEMSGGGAIIPSGAAMGSNAPSGSSTPNPKTRSQPGKTVPSAAPLRPLPILPGSRIAFFVNGQCQGTAFHDIYDYLPLRQTETQRKAKEKKRTREGVKEHRENPFDDGTLGYYPFISLFNEASIKINPGPNFEYPPPDDIDALLDELDKTQQPEAKQTKENDVPPFSSPVSMDVDPPATVNVPLKPEQDDPSTTMIPQTSETPASTRTWRPACELYSIFMASERALDEEEEKIARDELDKQDSIIKAEEEKRQQREKKKQAADARRKAKIAATAAAKGKIPTPSPTPGPADSSSSVNSQLDAKLEDEKAQSALGSMGGGLVLMNVYGSNNTSNTTSRSASPLGYHVTNASGPSPSPLRQSTAYQAYREDEEEAEEGETDGHEEKPFLSGMTKGGLNQKAPSASRSTVPLNGTNRTQMPSTSSATDEGIGVPALPGTAPRSTPLHRPGSRGTNPPSNSSNPYAHMSTYRQPSSSSTPFDCDTPDTPSLSEPATPAHDHPPSKPRQHQYPLSSSHTAQNPSHDRMSEAYADEGQSGGYTSGNADADHDNEQSEPDTDILLHAPSQRGEDDGSEYEHDNPREDEGAYTDTQSNMGEAEVDPDDPDAEPDAEAGDGGDYDMASEVE
ncbi:hypothetical protein CVT24_010417 [Panaeolus cyanescens]|uniref:B30.2/SPRY domain-containing protein n=1 Tax=Panaeolus cyanescens TaxID=181874 RepID=A0A409YPP0_9AGAR|nr:hypothetical protein CVT24_010417 [Panaeolus cyanescens]